MKEFIFLSDPICLSVPPPVHGFSSEAGFGQLLQDPCLSIAMGGRGSSSALFQLVKAHSGLALQITQLLDQTWGKC